MALSPVRRTVCVCAKCDGFVPLLNYIWVFAKFGVDHAQLQVVSMQGVSLQRSFVARSFIVRSWSEGFKIVFI